MMHAIRISLVFLISIGAVSCAHDGPGLRMMNERSEYPDDAPETAELNLASSAALNEEGQLKPRPEPRLALIWVHPQRLSHREQFWGAWMTLRLEDEHWENETATDLEPDQEDIRPKDSVLSLKRKKFSPHK